jgi:hypothetical protein
MDHMYASSKGMHVLRKIQGCFTSEAIDSTSATCVLPTTNLNASKVKKKNHFIILNYEATAVMMACFLHKKLCFVVLNLLYPLCLLGRSNFEEEDSH